MPDCNFFSPFILPSRPDAFSHFLLPIFPLVPCPSFFLSLLGEINNFFFLSLRLNSHRQNPLKIIWAPLGRWGVLQVLTNSHKIIKCNQECSGDRVQVTVEPCSRSHQTHNQTKQKPQKMCKNVLKYQLHAPPSLPSGPQICITKIFGKCHIIFI